MTTISIKQLESDKMDGKYSIGQYFLIDEEVYLLARVDYSTVGLIGLSSANRYADPIKVQDCYNITSKEFGMLVGQDEPAQLLSSVDINYKV